VEKYTISDEAYNKREGSLGDLVVGVLHEIFQDVIYNPKFCFSKVLAG
jgi:hypothetical protein